MIGFLKMNLQYAAYLTRHKFWVGVACFRAGLPYRALRHDMSKLRPSEWLAYLRSFYGEERTAKVREDFDMKGGS